MHELLDQQVAARIVAECRDADPLHRFQRASAIAEEVLAGLGLGNIARELRCRRVELGLIDRVAADERPPKVEPVRTPGLLLQGDDADAITGRKRRKGKEA